QYFHRFGFLRDTSLSKQALCFPFLALGCDCGNRSSDRKCIIVQYVLSSYLRARINDHRRLQIRSEEHTSELQSRFDLVCRLLLEKKNSTRALQPDVARQTAAPATAGPRRQPTRA